MRKLKLLRKLKGGNDALLGATTFRTKWTQPRFDMDSVLEGGAQACMAGEAAYILTLGLVDEVRLWGGIVLGVLMLSFWQYHQQDHPQSNQHHRLHHHQHQHHHHVSTSRSASSTSPGKQERVHLD